MRFHLAFLFLTMAVVPANAANFSTLNLCIKNPDISNLNNSRSPAIGTPNLFYESAHLKHPTSALISPHFILTAEDMTMVANMPIRDIVNIIVEHGNARDIQDENSPRNRFVLAPISFKSFHKTRNWFYHHFFSRHSLIERRLKALRKKKNCRYHDLSINGSPLPSLLQENVESDVAPSQLQHCKTFT